MPCIACVRTCIACVVHTDLKVEIKDNGGTHAHVRHARLHATHASHARFVLTPRTQAKYACRARTPYMHVYHGRHARKPRLACITYRTWHACMRAWDASRAWVACVNDVRTWRTWNPCLVWVWGVREWLAGTRGGRDIRVCFILTLPSTPLQPANPHARRTSCRYSLACDTLPSTLTHARTRETGFRKPSVPRGNTVITGIWKLKG